MGFIDLKKAFDNVQSEKLWETLANPHYEMPSKLVRVVRSLFTKSENAFIKTHGLGEWFTVDTGVRNGWVLFPLLFILCIILLFILCMQEVNEVEDLGVAIA